VPAVGAERQRLDARYRGKIEVTVKMRKQRATARRFPFQTITQSLGVDAHKQQVALSGEMFCGRFCDLRGIGKMDEAVTAIHLRSAKYGSALGFTP